MTSVSVLDTGVLIGISIEQDQHHERCVEYTLNQSHDIYATPTVRDEFERKADEIRSELADEIAQHRQAVIREIQKEKLKREDILYIRDQLLPDDPYDYRPYRFLYEYYTNKADDRVVVDRLEIELELEDMEAEVFEDAAAEYGGWRGLVNVWSQGIDEYPSIESELLVREGDDPDICIEAHHIASEMGANPAHLATGNPAHFKNQVGGEPESREENILRLTALTKIVDLSMSPVPN